MLPRVIGGPPEIVVVCSCRGRIAHKSASALPPEPEWCQPAQPSCRGSSAAAPAAGGAVGAGLSVTEYPARSVGHPGFGSSTVSSIVSPSGPVTMTQEPSSRSVLANLKASLRVSFSARNDPDTPSGRIARTRYPIPAFSPSHHDHHDSAKRGRSVNAAAAAAGGVALGWVCRSLWCHPTARRPSTFGPTSAQAKSAFQVNAVPQPLLLHFSPSTQACPT
jgi:hypothetical protein